MTDQDVDRAAVHHHATATSDVSLTATTTLCRDKLRSVVVASLRDRGADRVDALWRLVDRDNDDDRIDLEEVQRVANLAVATEQAAWKVLFREALDASPIDNGGTAALEPQGWRQKRRAVAERKRLVRSFERNLKRHFVEDLQQPHRIRCAYAWANKAHQNNKLDSVLVEEAGGGVGTTLMGRKRYVELHPKISLAEFREVQAIHFPQLDRVGSELLESYRDDLLVEQGKGRQRKELLWDCSLFFTGVCVLDYIILSL